MVASCATAGLSSAVRTACFHSKKHKVGGAARRGASKDFSGAEAASATPFAFNPPASHRGPQKGRFPQTFLEALGGGRSTVQTWMRMGKELAAAP